MEVFGRVSVRLDDYEIRNVLDAELQRLTKGYFIRGGVVMHEVNVYPHKDEGDEVILGNDSNPKFAVEVAAYRLIRALKHQRQRVVAGMAPDEA